MLRRILSALRHLGSALLEEQDGQDLVEYALLMAFIALAAVSVLTSLSANLSTLWDSVSNALSDAVSVSG
ncbi:MAG TPA: Flp family type IVb pilin [Bryobacteraceae bacterium]|nr:Flp family type IVb pilin [Bryobacteraceae bacterium]